MVCHIIYFVSFRFVLFRFDLFRFVFELFRFVLICFVSFRSVSFRSVSFLFRFALYRDPLGRHVNEPYKCSCLWRNTTVTLTQTDGRPTVGEPNLSKSGDVGRLSADVGTDFDRFFGRPTTFLSKHPT